MAFTLCLIEDNIKLGDNGNINDLINQVELDARIKDKKDIMNNLLQDYGDKTFICISHRKSSQQYFDEVLKFV